MAGPLDDFDKNNPYTNPNTEPTDVRGFRPDPMAGKVKDYIDELGRDMGQRITELLPKPVEDERVRKYGGIRATRLSDDPTRAADFVLAGPIAVEEALGKLAARALPAKSLESKLLQMGASKAELNVRGVTQYLAKNADRPIHPLEVARHLDENPYRLKETVYTDTPHTFPPKEVQDQYNATYDAAKKRFWDTPYGTQEYGEALAAFEKAEADMKYNVPGWGIAEGGGGGANGHSQYPGIRRGLSSIVDLSPAGNQGQPGNAIVGYCLKLGVRSRLLNSQFFSFLLLQRPAWKSTSYY